jgi:hypothetical protein
VPEGWIQSAGEPEIPRLCHPAGVRAHLGPCPVVSLGATDRLPAGFPPGTCRWCREAPRIG